MHLTMDYETRSPEDINKGPWKYFEHPCTQILMSALKVDNAPARIWVAHWLLKQYPELCLFFDIVSDMEFKSVIRKSETIEAHNAMFERAGWESILQPLGMGIIPPEKWRCSAANAARFKLPRDLDGLCKALEVSEKKDSDGHDLMKKMCSPIGYKNGDPLQPVYRESLEDFVALIDYCLQDVEAEYAASKALPPMPGRDLKVWHLDQRINARGVAVDTESLRIIQEHREKHFAPLAVRFSDLTGGLKPSQCGRLKEWIEEHGVIIPDLRADTVEVYANDPSVPDAVREALEIRSIVGKSSLAKIDKMLECVCRDGRVRDILMYHGAGTGRWSGKGIQLQNFPRESTRFTEDIVRDIRDLDPPMFELIYGPVGPALVQCLRGMVWAGKGSRLVDADFSSVEAVFAAWITKDEKTLEVFRSGGKVYFLTAATIFGCEPEDIKKDTPEYLIGKVGELSLTYQGGVKAYTGMGRTYKLDLRVIPEAILPTASDYEIEKSTALIERMFSLSSLNEMRITKDTAVAIDIIKTRWRENRPAVVNSWYALEDCAMKAVMYPGSVFQWNGVYFGVQGKFLCMMLPSGRSLYYYKPEIRENVPPWVKKEADEKGLKGEERKLFEDERRIKNVTYIGAKGKGGVQRFGQHGGRWLENLCSGGCTDLLSYAMINVEEAGYRVAFTVHDQIPSEASNGFGSLEHYISLMTKKEAWAADFPLASDGYEQRRFKK